jgi:hypothetical protein
MDILESIPLSLWLMSAIGGVIFAAVFNIPARARFLSIESNTRDKAIRYDALNFLVFYITFILPLGSLWGMNTGDWSPLWILTVMFVTYSVAFWLVLRSYIAWKD